MRILNTVYYLSLITAAFSKKVDKVETVEPLVPIFNLESGFYNNSTLELEINFSDPNAVIYYTLDGTIPTDNSTLYENPIVFKNKSDEENVLSALPNVDPDKMNFKPLVKVKKGNVIRAVAKLSDGSYSGVVSGTYFVGLNKNELYGDNPVISIITDPANLFDYENGIYTTGKYYDDWLKEDPENENLPNYNKKGNYSFKGKQYEKPATIEYFPGNDNTKGFSQNFGMRISGGVSRSFIQKSFRVISREEYGKKNLKYQLIPNNMRSDGTGPIEKYKSFLLRNGGNDHKELKIRDMLIQNLVNNRDYETQQCDIAVAFIDGEYWGFYGLCEDYSEHYIANNYNIDDNNVIIIKNNKVEAGEENDYQLFNNTLNYIYNNDLSKPTNYKKLLKMMDVESFAWYAAAITYTNNKDSFLENNNWAMWRVRDPVDNVLKADGIWRFMLFDFDMTSGRSSSTGNNYTKFQLPVVLDPEYDPNSIGANIIRILIKNDEFKNLFINALCDMRNIDFESGRVTEFMNQLYNKIEPIMISHVERFGPENYIENPSALLPDRLKVLKTWYAGRYDVFPGLVQNLFGFEPVVNVTVSSSDYTKGTFKVNNGWKNFTENYVGEYFKENILYLTAAPANGRKFKNWTIKHCKLAQKPLSSTKYTTSSKKTIGIYPLEGCQVKAYFK